MLATLATKYPNVRVIVELLGLVAGMALGYGSLKQKVIDNQTSIIRELDLIHKQLDRIETQHVEILSGEHGRR